MASLSLSAAVENNPTVSFIKQNYDATTYWDELHTGMKMILFVCRLQGYVTCN
jgi:hypothetical protein